MMNMIGMTEMISFPPRILQVVKQTQKIVGPMGTSHLTKRSLISHMTLEEKNKYP